MLEKNYGRIVNIASVSGKERASNLTLFPFSPLLVSIIKGLTFTVREGRKCWYARLFHLQGDNPAMMIVTRVPLSNMVPQWKGCCDRDDQSDG